MLNNSNTLSSRFQGLGGILLANPVTDEQIAAIITTMATGRHFASPLSALPTRAIPQSQQHQG